jgi:hypothetical protein
MVWSTEAGRLRPRDGLGHWLVGALKIVPPLHPCPCRLGWSPFLRQNDAGSSTKQLGNTVLAVDAEPVATRRSSSCFVRNPVYRSVEMHSRMMLSTSDSREVRCGRNSFPRISVSSDFSTEASPKRLKSVARTRPQPNMGSNVCRERAVISCRRKPCPGNCRCAVASEAAGGTLPRNSPCSSSWAIGPGTGATGRSRASLEDVRSGAPLDDLLHRATASGFAAVAWRGFLCSRACSACSKPTLRGAEQLPRHTDAGLSGYDAGAGPSGSLRISALRE